MCRTGAGTEGNCRDAQSLPNPSEEDAALLMLLKTPRTATGPRVALRCSSAQKRSHGGANQDTTQQVTEMPLIAPVDIRLLLFVVGPCQTLSVCQLGYNLKSFFTLGGDPGQTSDTFFGTVIAVGTRSEALCL